ncbi:MAG: hypothetical protein E4H37_07885 [Gemmatimonadales bacterium]|nr:MAG: hypothetical protein E4H37_07885 [Gemmatimonadales bacterium]
MDRLKEPDRSEALLLLGESFQEQGRMPESMEQLNLVSDSACHAVVSRRNVLQLFAKRYVGSRSLDDNRRLAFQLLDEADLAVETNTRLRALWMAATCIRDLREAALLSEVQARLDRESWLDLSTEDKAEFALARAFCFYFSGENRRSVGFVTEIVRELEARGISNSVYLSLITGLAAMHASLGDYPGAVQLGVKAVRVASRVGAERRMRMAAGNLSLAHCRMGNVPAQLHWANKSAAPLDGSYGLFHHYQVQHLRAQAYAMMGRTLESLEALAEGDQVNGFPVPTYLRQAWHLKKADVFALLGRGAEALRSARAGTANGLSKSQSDLFSGPHARWSARVAVEDGEGMSAVRNMLRGHLEAGDRLDRLDQIEILNAMVWMDAKEGIVSQAEQAEMWRRLGEVPIGVTNQLRLLGMLDL